MKKFKKNLSTFLMLPALVAIVLAGSFPFRKHGTVLFGLLRSEFMVFCVLLFISFIFLLATLFSIIAPGKFIKVYESIFCNTGYKKNTFFIASMFFIVASYVLCTPDDYFGRYQEIFNRLHPLFMWACLFSLQIIASILIFQLTNADITNYISRKQILWSLVLFAGLSVFWLFIAISGYGINGTNSYWSKNGVPILWTQVFLILFTGIAFQRILARKNLRDAQGLYVDIVLILLIWIVSVTAWYSQNFVPGVFNTVGVPPTNEIFPINDSFIFDKASQKLLLGQNIIPEVQDKPMYISFLAMLHAIAGTSYKNFYLLQIIFFAFTPVIGYFIGKKLHSSALGIIFALALIIKERNAIALTNYIHVSTSKMILSEPLTTFGILLSTFFLIIWFKNIKKYPSYLWLAGGILGITSLIRLNALSIIVSVVFLIGFTFNFKLKNWVKHSFVYVLFVALGMFPWITRNFVVSGNPVNFIHNKTSGVIVSQRYIPMIAVENTPTSTSTTSKFESYKDIANNILTNYLHNLVGITIILPPTFELLNLHDMVRLPYWRSDWTGSLQPGGFWIILFVLAVTSVGIIYLWKYNKTAGLVPLFSALGYNITTAVSLTSGGRYLVPIDWCILFYFMVGLLELANFLFFIIGWNQIVSIEKKQSMQTANDHLPIGNLIKSGLIILAIGCIPVLLEFIPRQYSPKTASAETIIQNAFSKGQPLSLEDVNKIQKLESNLSLIAIHGKAFYPRFFERKKGEDIPFEYDPLIGKNSFDRLTFFLAGGEKDTAVIFRTTVDTLPQDLSGSDVWIIGCPKQDYVEAIFINIHTNENSYTIWEQPLSNHCQDE